jgi:hypothetical protein
VGNAALKYAQYSCGDTPAASNEWICGKALRYLPWVVLDKEIWSDCVDL